MTDTPAHIHQLQLAIFNRMTTGERIAICVDMMEEGQQQLKANIRRKHPDWVEADVIAEMVRRMYSSDFAPEKLEEICESVRVYHLLKPNC